MIRISDTEDQAAIPGPNGTRMRSETFSNYGCDLTFSMRSNVQLRLVGLILKPKQTLHVVSLKFCPSEMMIVSVEDEQEENRGEGEVR